MVNIVVDEIFEPRSQAPFLPSPEDVVVVLRFDQSNKTSLTLPAEFSFRHGFFTKSFASLCIRVVCTRGNYSNVSDANETMPERNLC